MRWARCAALALFAAAGCRDGGCRIDESEAIDVLARSYCDAVWGHCGQGPGVSEISCEDRMKRSGEALRDELSGHAFRYDADCALALREAYDMGEPDTELHFGGQPHPLACPPWVGTLPEGEPCSVISGFDECAPPLSCSAGTCMQARQPVPEGEACFVIDVEYGCEVGLTCDFGVCAVPPAIGEPCTNDCAAGAMCDRASDTCVAAPGRGEPCDGVCGVGLDCIDEICDTARPAVCSMGPPWPPP